MLLSGLFIYPIKSVKGIALTEGKIQTRGLQYDRRWMLLDDQNKFLTQREFPKLATISLSVEATGLQAGLNGQAPLLIPFVPAADSSVPVQIWNSNCPAALVGSEADEWFSDVLGASVRLVYMPDDTRRLIDAAKGDDIVSFADAYPFLLANEASLANLNSRLQERVGMERFRPNFVVNGTTAFAEDDWKVVTIGTTNFRVAKACSRCVMTTVDQERGVRSGEEPLRTLASFRKFQNEVRFGQNLIATEEGTTVRVGDQVSIVN